MSDTPHTPEPEDDNELPPDDVVEQAEIDREARGGTEPAGEHPDQPEVAAQDPPPDQPA